MTLTKIALARQMFDAQHHSLAEIVLPFPRIRAQEIEGGDRGTRTVRRWTNGLAGAIAPATDADAHLRHGCAD